MNFKLFNNAIIKFIIVLFFLMIIYILYLSNQSILLNDDKKSSLVDVTVIYKNNCEECTKLADYLKVYKKAGVKFGEIKKIKYGDTISAKFIKKYKINKLPFIIFSKELKEYKTISSSWNNTFGYINQKNEFIPTDIIPPYFDIKKIKSYDL